MERHLGHYAQRVENVITQIRLTLLELTSGIVWQAGSAIRFLIPILNPKDRTDE